MADGPSRSLEPLDGAVASFITKVLDSPTAYVWRRLSQPLGHAHRRAACVT